ncbi:MAG: holo-ACP synthase [Deltaproteobacteria bacterium]|nr:holo-ACP synthase [Deltaproteobacteria bacterium]
MIHGIGIDIVHIPKFKKALERWGDRFTEKLFTKSELAYCCERKFSEQHLAVRFAAKEAFFKALGKGIKFTDVEVLNNQDGKPCIVFKPKGLSCEKGVTQGFSLDNPHSALRTHLTLSHHGEYCIAQVMLEVSK